MASLKITVLLALVAVASVSAISYGGGINPLYSGIGYGMGYGAYPGMLGGYPGMLGGYAGMLGGYPGMLGGYGMGGLYGMPGYGIGMGHGMYGYGMGKFGKYY